MNVEESNLNLFRISISRLNKIKEKKNKDKNYKKEDKLDNIKCQICWESSNLDFTNFKCLSCNNLIKFQKDINSKKKKPVNLFNQSNDSQDTPNDIQNKSEKFKIYFNNNYYKNTLKEETFKSNDQENLRADNCDANCKCLIV